MLQHGCALRLSLPLPQDWRQPLWLGRKRGDPGQYGAQVVEALLAGGAAVNATCGENSNTPLQLAALNSSLKAPALAPQRCLAPFSKLSSSLLLTAQLERMTWSGLHQKLPVSAGLAKFAGLLTP